MTKPAGLLQPIVLPERPFEEIGMDIIGSFSISLEGENCIVIATEYMTRRAETAAHPKRAAQEVVKFFILQVCDGIKELKFLSRTAKRHSLSSSCSDFYAITIPIPGETAYHPQMNGVTKRMNRDWWDILCMYVDVEDKTWEKILPKFPFAYNTGNK